MGPDRAGFDGRTRRMGHTAPSVSRGRPHHRLQARRALPTLAAKPSLGGRRLLSVVPYCRHC